MTFANGSVVKFDYTLYLEDSDKPVESSLEEVAHEHGLPHNHGQSKPLTLIIGQRQIIPGLEEAIVAKGKVGAEFTVDLPAEKAYGERDPKAVKMVPMAQFRREKVQPRVGDVINFEGRRAIVSRVAGGRVMLDMNHELAGKRLRYDVVIREAVEDTPSKVQAVLDGFFSGAIPTARVGDKVEVEIPDQAKFDQNWPMQKFRVLAQLRSVTNMEMDIVLTETYPANPAPSADEEE